MENCQHCKMYMKPMTPNGPPAEGLKAICEFCGETTAVIKKREDGRLYWERVIVE